MRNKKTFGTYYLTKLFIETKFPYIMDKNRVESTSKDEMRREIKGGGGKYSWVKEAIRDQINKPSDVIKVKRCDPAEVKGLRREVQKIDGPYSVKRKRTGKQEYTCFIYR